MVTENKSVVTTNDEETVAYVTRSSYSILTIYERASEPYTKLSSHTIKLSNTLERRNVLKTGKRDSITIRHYCATTLNARFEQISIKSEIAKQFMYNWLQLAKILSKFYRKKLKAAEGEATIISFPLNLGRFLAYELPDRKILHEWTRVSSKLALKKPKQQDPAVVG